MMEETVPFWVTVSILGYWLIGMMSFVFSSRRMIQSRKIGLYFPNDHVRYVCLSFSLWPLRSVLYRHYRAKLQAAGDQDFL